MELHREKGRGKEVEERGGGEGGTGHMNHVLHLYSTCTVYVMHNLGFGLHSAQNIHVCVHTHVFSFVSQSK